MKNIFIVTIITLALLGLSSLSFAETKTQDDGWNFMIAPLFLWGMNIDGTSELGPVTTPLKLDFKDDLLENLAGVFTLHFEASKKDWTIFAEYQYSKIDPTVETPLGPPADIELTNQLGELGVAYHVGTWGINTVQVLGGARYTRQDLEVTFGPGIPLVDNTAHWWDGFLGMRLFTQISDNWRFIARGDIGGGGSDFVWNLAAMFDYRFKDWGSVFFGYKWLDYDYEDGSGLDRFAYDALQQGPLAGLAFYW